MVKKGSTIQFLLKGMAVGESIAYLPVREQENCYEVSQIMS